MTDTPDTAPQPLARLDLDVAASERETRAAPSVRTHLANERTFLAWLRTGLAVMALGVAAEAGLYGRGNEALRALIAVLLVVLGTGCVVVGRSRHRATARDIKAGQWRDRPLALDVTVVVIAIVGVLAIAWVVLIER